MKHFISDVISRHILFSPQLHVLCHVSLMERQNEATKCLDDFIRILGYKNEEFIGTYNTIHTSRVVPTFISQVCAKHEI